MPSSPSPISPTTMPRASNDSTTVSVHVRAPTPPDGERTVPEAESASQRRHSSPQWLQWLTPAHFAPLAHFKQHAKRLSWGNGGNTADADKEQASSSLTGDAAEPGGAPSHSASVSVSPSIAPATSESCQGGAPPSSRTSPRRAPRAQTILPAPVASAHAVVKPDPNVTNIYPSQSHPSQPRSIPEPPAHAAAMPTAQAHLTPGSSEVPLLDPSPDLGTSPLPSLDTASRKHEPPTAGAGEVDIPSPSPGLAHDAVVARFLRPRRPTPQRSMTAPTTPTPSSPNPDANASGHPGHPLARSTSGGPGVPEPDERDVADILDGPLEPGGGRVTRALGAQIDAVLKAQDEIGAAHLALEGIGRRIKTKDGKGELKEDAGEDELERRKRGVEQIMHKLSVLSTTLKTYHALGTPALVFPSKRDDGPPIPTAKIAHPAAALPVVPASEETDTLAPVRVGGAGFSAPVVGPKSAPAFAETLVASPETIAPPPPPPPAPTGRRGSRKTSLDIPRAPIPTTAPAPPPLTLPPLSLNTKAKAGMPLSPLSPSSAQRAAAAWLDRGVPKKPAAASPASEKNMHERPW